MVFPSSFPTKTLCVLLLSPIGATCLVHPILLYSITQTIFGEEYRSLSSSLLFITCRKSRYTYVKVSYFSCSTCYVLGGLGIETRWGARHSAPIQIGRGAHPASCTLGSGSFPGVKQPGRGVDHPTPSSAEVKERVECTFYSLSVPLPIVSVLFLLIYVLFDCVCNVDW